MPVAPLTIAAGFLAHWMLAHTTVVLIALAPSSVSVGELAYFDMPSHAQKTINVPAGDHAVKWSNGNGKSVVVHAPRGGDIVVVPSPTGCTVRFDAHKKPAALLDIGTPGAPHNVVDGDVVGVVGCDHVGEAPTLLYARLDDNTAVRR